MLLFWLQITVTFTFDNLHKLRERRRRRAAGEAPLAAGEDEDDERGGDFDERGASLLQTLSDLYLSGGLSGGLVVA